MDKKDALTAMSALAHDKRLDVFRLLVTAGPRGAAAGEISTTLRVRQNTMSTNLSVLEHAGLVTRKREGRSIRYFANYQTMAALLAFLVRDCCKGDTAMRKHLTNALAQNCS